MKNVIMLYIANIKKEVKLVVYVSEPINSSSEFRVSRSILFSSRRQSFSTVP